MSNEEIIGDAERQAQQLISEKQPTAAEAGAPAGTAVAQPMRLDQVGETDFNDGVDVEEEFVVRSFDSILAEAAGDGGQVRLTIKPELDFVMTLHDDEVQELLLKSPNFEFNDQKLNLIQALSKLNPRSNRIGVIREPLRDFTTALSNLMSSQERIIVTPDSARLIIDTLVGEAVRSAENTLYSNFPIGEDGPYIPLGEDDDVQEIPATEYVRVAPLLQIKHDALSTEAIANVEVSVKFIVHLRIPLLLRESSDKFEKTLKTHFKFLGNSGIKAGIPTAVYASFNSQDLVRQPVLDAFNWIRQNDPEVEILSYRNVEGAAEFIGVPGFDAETYVDALFNGGDFIAAFSLEKEAE